MTMTGGFIVGKADAAAVGHGLHVSSPNATLTLDGNATIIDNGCSFAAVKAAETILTIAATWTGSANIAA